jgi:VanZ family protein
MRILVRHLQLLRVLAWLAIAAIVVLSLLPGQDRPHLVEVSQFEHLGAYGLAGAILALAYARPRWQVATGFGLTALAGALELAQLLVPGRNARVIDWAAGSAGAWAGVVAMAGLAWLMMRRRDLARGAVVRASSPAD